MGTKEYNYKLSLERAMTVKNILIQNNINEKDIKIIAKGEDDLLIKTADQTRNPANRRAEIKPIN
jgi:OOP family OmpA-OmpF porin